ncbi:hypothetical protein AB833_04410 [Chromatiales bacterium (ex Bugula neritina AB1)]|nr:hypothetical protein AB833_04410 [Chromatiales bacterium (ex Bugula neritina AB1)]
MIIVFAGPTISPNEILPHLDCMIAPPVKHGDIIKALQHKPESIAIIDGYFEGAASVWHKEILYALDQGVPVYGSSSMGALRASELYQFGMIGVGQIFAWYRDGIIEDDDEVAVSHGPAEVNYLTLSEPMVNIRATLTLACEQNIIDETTLQALLHTAKSTFYKQRNWSHLLEISNQWNKSNSGLTTLVNWLTQHRVDLKKQDALQLLRTMKSHQTAQTPVPASPFHFEWTHVWEAAYQEYGTPRTDKSIPPDSDSSIVLDELRLNPDRYQNYRDRALLNWLASNRVTIDPAEGSAKEALKQFRLVNSLSTREQLVNHMAAVDLTENNLIALLKEVARVNQLRQHAGDLQAGIIDQLKLQGDYLNLLDRAARKKQALQAAGLSAGSADALTPTVLSWYFREKLGVAVPRNINEHLISIDLTCSDDFYRLITEFYLYCVKCEQAII